MSGPADHKSPDGDVVGLESQSAHIDHSADLNEKADLAAFKGDAIEAENVELRMGVWEAVKLYPMASFWAFVMSSTIVSTLFSISPPLPYCKESLLTAAVRSWSPTVSSSWALSSP